MRRLIVLMAGVAAGVVAAVFAGARADLPRAAERHEGMPDVTADDAPPHGGNEASGDTEGERDD